MNDIILLERSQSCQYMCISIFRPESSTVLEIALMLGVLS